MEISADLLCLFTAEIERRNDTYVIELPSQEVTQGWVEEGEAYRVALLPVNDRDRDAEVEESVQNQSGGVRGPPVEEGEERTVEIEDIGEQGDGIARVERGYVVIIPDTELHERVTIRIRDVRENVAFGEVIKRHHHFE